MASRHIRDLGAISTRIRVSRDRAEIACVLREAHTYINVPKAVATYLSVRPGSWRCDLRRESYWAARGVPNGARPRADPLWGRSRPGCRKAKIVSARPGAVWDPTGGSGHFLALKISKGARAYGQIGGYGLMYAPGHVLVDQSSTCDLLELRERGTQASHQSVVNATWVVEIAEPATSGRAVSSPERRASRRASVAVSDCMNR